MENPNALAAEETLRWKLQMEAELQSIEDDLKELDDDEKSLTPTPRTLMFLVKPNLNANARQRKIFEAEISTRRATIDSFACFIDALRKDSLSDGLFIFEELQQKLTTDATKSFPHPTVKKVYAEAIKQALNMKLLVSGLLSPPPDFVIHLIK